MQQIRNHKIKREMPETSSTRLKDSEEHDLAYYIHDRVELMHQVFSVIKPKELKAMAPECVQHISIDDLQELCTEELLGISSKRLCAILDGAEPPSDTESSGSEQLETISLDSISSDDEILSQPCSKNKKHKHKKHKSKVKHKRKNSNNSDRDKEEVEDRSKASRAGLTVLELLELQARARAIRAQLQQDNINMPTEQVTHTEKNDSSDEVEIKEEPPEVVEISSEDEKPKIEDLPVKPPSPHREETTRGSVENSTTVKRINNLVITVPQSKPSQKIKLKRNKIVTISNNRDTLSTEKEKNDSNHGSDKTIDSNGPVKTLDIQNITEDEPKSEQNKTQSKTRKKQKKKSKTIEKDGSDHDEITLQLSDTEKMDLLEDFNRKDYDNFTSSDSEDSESSSESESDDTAEKSKRNKDIEKVSKANTTSEIPLEGVDITEGTKISYKTSSVKLDHSKVKEGQLQNINTGKNSESAEIISHKQSENIDLSNEKVTILDDKEDREKSRNIDKNQDDAEFSNINSGNEDISITKENVLQNKLNIQEKGNEEQVEEGEIVSNIEINKDLSEGEVSDKNSSGLDPCETLAEIVCISDEESKTVKKVKNKKKEKKSKKEKRSKKSQQDFHESSDQNFFENSKCKKTDKLNPEQQYPEQKTEHNSDNIITIYDDDNEVLEILELSDDSCYSDAEGESVLSKEPTAAEIAALSAKIDEIHNDDIVTNKKETNESVENDNEVENISWRDRYLGSKKVKKVLTTASILNALRKKNKEIKAKLGVNKNVSDAINSEVYQSDVLVEGSIEHFNTLQGSTKYVNPVSAQDESNQNEENSKNKVVTKEMEKDAKMLLKMYKKLLKYNDLNKQKDPSKKKKKKQKKNKEKEKVKTSE